MPDRRTLSDRVKRLLLSGQRFSVVELRERVGGTDSSVSARVRELRKAEYGGFDVKCERDSRGVYRYWIPQPEPGQPGLFGDAA